MCPHVAGLCEACFLRLAGSDDKLVPAVIYDVIGLCVRARDRGFGDRTAIDLFGAGGET